MINAFFSLTSLVGGISSGRFSQNDLDTGFFCLLRERRFVMDQPGELPGTAEDYQQVVRAIQQAESDGRALWFDGIPTYGPLYDFLQKNGFLELVQAIGRRREDRLVCSVVQKAAMSFKITFIYF